MLAAAGLFHICAIALLLEIIVGFSDRVTVRNLAVSGLDRVVVRQVPVQGTLMNSPLDGLVGDGAKFVLFHKVGGEVLALGAVHANAQLFGSL